MSWAQEQDRAEIIKLKKLVLDLTSIGFRNVPELALHYTHFSLGQCAEMLKQIDDIRMEADRGKL
jgi:hypothetical protein